MDVEAFGGAGGVEVDQLCVSVVVGIVSASWYLNSRLLLSVFNVAF